MGKSIKIFAFCAFALVLSLSNFCCSLDTEVFGATSPASKARILMEYGTGEVLEEYNSTEHLPIASVTKLTTLLLAFEAIEAGKLELEQSLVASENAAGMGGSQVFIDAGADYTVKNLLHAVIISSANDASVVLAEAIAGSEDAFVDMMNKKVASLGGKDTNYTNCTGLPSAMAFSCANDVALVMREVISHPLYFEISGIWMEDFVHPSGRITQMANTNKLLRSYQGCDAGKTGSTAEAGYCMSATAKRSDMRLIAVVLGAENSKDRFKECATLLDYGFANYSSECILDCQQAVDIPLNINKAKNGSAIKPKESYYVLNKKGEDKNIEVNYVLDTLSAPLSKGTVVGRAIVTQGNVVIAEIDLVLEEDVAEKSFWDEVQSITSEW